MTAKEIYDGVVVEMNKINAESFSIEQFNYCLNKTILSFTNERHQYYQENQQLTDDLRVLRRSCKFSSSAEGTMNESSSIIVDFDGVDKTIIYVSSVTDIKENITVDAGELVTSNGSGNNNTIVEIDTTEYPYKVTLLKEVLANIGSAVKIKSGPLYSTNEYDDDDISETLTNKIYSITLPSADYMHILACRTYWKGIKSNGNKAMLMFAGKRLTDEARDGIENNVYLKPKYNRPYYIIEDNFYNTGIDKFQLGVNGAYQNKPKIDIFVGSDGLKNKRTNISLDSIRIEYLKIPEKVNIDEVDVWTSGDDSSQVLEFPDYLLNKFISMTTDYLMVATNNQGLSAHVQVNQQIHPDIPKVPQQQAPQQPAAQQQQQQQTR